LNRIELSGVRFTYPGAAQPAVEEVSVQLESGNLIALYGANGSGKSTLARLIAGLLNPAAGKITRPQNAGWNGVSMVMQEPSAQLLAGSVAEEIAWGLENLALPQAEIARRVEEALNHFDLSALAETPPESLSDGQRQLVVIAAALVMEPDFIIFDEATAFLDPYWRKRLWGEALSIRNRCGVLWVTARSDEARRCEDIWFLESGHLTRLSPSALK
jgi:energy-coupling factor transporter ATP-binding protein EcfA2